MAGMSSVEVSRCGTGGRRHSSAQPSKRICRDEPVGIGEIPVDRACEPGFKRFRRPPPKRSLRVRGIDCIAEVMARPVGDEGNLSCIGLAVRARSAGVEKVADHEHEIDVAKLATSPEQIRVAWPALADGSHETGDVVGDVEPVRTFRPVP